MSEGIHVFFEQRYYGKYPKILKGSLCEDIVKNNIPVLVVFGWGARSLKPYIKPLLSLSKTKIVLAMSTVFANFPVICSTDTYEQKAHLLLSELKDHGITKVDVIACSEGAIITTLASVAESGIFRNIIFVNPAGFGAPRNPVEFIFAYVKELLSGVKEALIQKTFWKKTARVCNGTLRRFVTHPIRSLWEASCIAKADVRRYLSVLKEKGIGVSFLLASNDSLFPPKKIRADIANDLFVEMRENKGRHSNFITEETDTAIEMLSVLENQKSK